VLVIVFTCLHFLGVEEKIKLENMHATFFRFKNFKSKQASRNRLAEKRNPLIQAHNDAHPERKVRKCPVAKEGPYKPSQRLKNGVFRNKDQAVKNKRNKISSACLSALYSDIAGVNIKGPMKFSSSSCDTCSKTFTRKRPYLHHLSVCRMLSVPVSSIVLSEACDYSTLPDLICFPSCC
jgi:hypothetical protein